MSMSSPTVTTVSECFVKPLREPSYAHHPVNLTPWELGWLSANYSQKGLLFAKPTHQDFSIAVFLDDLRRTLAATLAHFPTFTARLATQIQQNPPSSVIYLDTENSPGVKLVYAKAEEATMADILTPVDVPTLVHALFDLNDAVNHDGHTLPLLSIKVTELADGIFVGGSVNHMVADGTSFWHFMATWSEIFKCKGQDSPIPISRPPKRYPTGGVNLPYTHPDQFIVRCERTPFKERIIHFSRPLLATIKAKANAECDTTKISSLQAVSALVWRCVTRARGLSHDQETGFKFVINNRRRLSPPLSDDYVGNPVQSVKATAKVGDLLTNGLGWAAMRLHEAVVNHNDKAVKEWGESWVKKPVILPVNRLLEVTGVHVGSSPWFDMYGCEFGLGKAVAARAGPTNKADGKVTLFPGSEGGGSMDLEVCLTPEHMVAFAADEELVTVLGLK